MARLSDGSLASPVSGTSHEATSTELASLLSRLQQNLLHPTPERERLLRTSEYQRAKAESNLEFAGATLARLENDLQNIKAPTRRIDSQVWLSRQREIFEVLQDRLEDLRQLAIEDDEDDSDVEDLLAHIETPSESMDSRSSEARHTPAPDDTSSDEEETPEPAVPQSPPPAAPAAAHPTISPPPNATSPVATPPPRPAAAPGHSRTISRSAARYTPAHLYKPDASTELSPPESPATSAPAVSQPSPPQPLAVATQTAQTLRARSSAKSTEPTSHATGRATLFANRRKPAEPQTSTATAEAILDHQRAEQDVLSDSILKMAGALKESSKKFSTSLEADKEVLGRAGEGINKTERGMEATRGRMGTLRKMTEGKGWLGRMMLYAWVYGLMLALVLFVFVMPKLRF